MVFVKGLKVLKDALKEGPSVIEGVHNYSAFLDILSELYAKKDENAKTLIILPNEDACDEFLKKLQTFDFKYEFLPSDGASPASGIEPSSQLSRQRTKFLHKALNNKDISVFISHPEALLKKTITPEKLNSKTKTFEFADEFFQNPAESLELLGYSPTQFVESEGQYSDKGGVFDIFSTAHEHPIRIELFGNDIESMRFFSVENQRSLDEVKTLILPPAREALYETENSSRLISEISKVAKSQDWLQDVIHKVRKNIPFERQEFFLPVFWSDAESAFSFFDEKTNIIVFDQSETDHSWSSQLEIYKTEAENSQTSLLDLEEVYSSKFLKKLEKFKYRVNICPLSITELKDINAKNKKDNFTYSTSGLKESIKTLKSSSSNWDSYKSQFISFFNNWEKIGDSVILSCKTSNAVSRAASYFKEFELDYEISTKAQALSPKTVCIVKKNAAGSFRYKDEGIVWLRFEDLFGRERVTKAKTGHKEYFEKLDALRIGDMNTDDLVVHVQHGVGVFKGLKTISLQGVPAECIEVQYDKNDKLFLPVHKIYQLRKFSGNPKARSLDKLGGNFWQKTKAKVKNKLREIAEDLIQLYAKRKTALRNAFSTSSKDSLLFESQFPFEETVDQQKAIDEIYSDLSSESPMDRLVCGDVGFGKTEVAMRAAFQVLLSGKQVAVLAPTTVLSLQHLQSFEKRFKDWPFEIRGLNRFIVPKKVKDTIKGLSEGRVDIVIGTHRVLSQDINFKDLGLLIVDEEQKFGVKQKEKIKKLKTNLDILSLSATPIPRTLNMGFLGVRDLSLITTPPKNRLPVKTYVSKHNLEIVKKAVENEIKRGGQVYFVHNRVQSIYGLYEELKQAMPDVRIGLGHGQMSERDLENVVMDFFNKKIDVLLATTIIESGMDIPNANTIMIHNAQNFGLSQLYQLRGRVGRSDKRAYCYLLIPQNKELDKDQKEKLKILQENSELGSGLKIAHYDLELRGAGNLLGEAQSGHADSIGYDFYIELLDEALKEARGESLDDKFDPDINIPLPSLIPSNYIQDFKVRLYYYRRLNQISSDYEIDEIELELQDQFGKVPDEVINLFFLCATKNFCKKLGIKEIKAGPKNLALRFIEKPALSPEKIFELVKKSYKKYRLTPDQRLSITFEEMTWTNIYEEIKRLEDFC